MSGSESGSGSGPEEEEFVVEKIRNKRMIKGKVEYFLKWVGYEECDNTWEPEENLGCPDLIAEFERKWEERENKKKEKEGGGGKHRSLLSGGLSSSAHATTTATVARGGGDEENKVKKVVKKERERDAEGGGGGGREGGSAAGSSSAQKKDKSEANASKRLGFDRGLKPERIIGATDCDGELTFLMKWSGTDQADLVPAKLANVKCPQTVIAFYEERLTWHTNAMGNHDDDDDF